MVFYRSFYEALRDLDNNTKAILYDAIFDYGLNFKEPELTGIAKTVFTLIRPQLDANIRKFDNGSKGGRPTKEEPTENLNETKEEPKQNQRISKTKANVNVNANDNGNGNSNEKENVVLPPSLSSLDQKIAKAHETVIPYLNKLTGKSFKPDTAATKKLIAARVKDGHGWQAFKTVMDGRFAAWSNDPKMREYLRPETLFGSKFESYLNASPENSKQDDDDGFNIRYTANGTPVKSNMTFANPIL